MLPAQQRSRSALIADRDPDTRSLYAEFLKLNGWCPETAADGREALAKALAESPDVLITETRLPGISGLELCRLLRSDPATRALPIVIVTADAMRSELDLARSVGANAVMCKPCLPEAVLEQVQQVMVEPPETVAVAAAPKARSLKRLHQRGVTSTPPNPPPALRCPSCDRILTYDNSHVGGISAKFPEQWDYYTCASGCGRYQYRHRTRKLRLA
jgi:CheY-like chemotaxis protein